MKSQAQVRKQKSGGRGEPEWMETLASSYKFLRCLAEAAWRCVEKDSAAASGLHRKERPSIVDVCPGHRRGKRGAAGTFITTHHCPNPSPITSTVSPSDKDRDLPGSSPSSASPASNSGTEGPAGIPSRRTVLSRMLSYTPGICKFRDKIQFLQERQALDAHLLSTDCILGSLPSLSLENN